MASGPLSISIGHHQPQVFYQSEDLRFGKRFLFDITVAFIAAGLELSSTKFGEEYISDSAKLELSQLPLSIRIAKVCLDERKNSARMNIVHCWSHNFQKLILVKRKKKIPEDVGFSYSKLEAA